MLLFWVTWPHTGRIVTQWRHCEQSKDWKGQTYHQPLLLRSEISLFWRTSYARDFLFSFLSLVRLCGAWNYTRAGRAAPKKERNYRGSFFVTDYPSRLVSAPTVLNRSPTPLLRPSPLTHENAPLLRSFQIQKKKKKMNSLVSET